MFMNRFEIHCRRTLRHRIDAITLPLQIIFVALVIVLTTACNSSSNPDEPPIMGWAIGDPQNSEQLFILATRDGVNWFIQHEFTAPLINDVFAIDANTAWIAGQDGQGRSMLLYTRDGGASWTNALETMRSSTPVNSVHFSSPEYGIAVGDDGLILETVNGGNNWFASNYRFTAAQDSLRRVHSFGEEAIAVGVYPADATYGFYRTDYIGWRAGEFGLADLPPTRISDVFFLNDQQAYITTGNGWVLNTDDGGRQWNYFGTQASFFQGLLSIYAFDELTIYVGSSSTSLSFTNDGGLTWQQAEIRIDADEEPPPAIDVIKISALDPGNIWFAGYDVNGSDGSIYYRKTGMDHFARAKLPRPMGIFGVAMVGSLK